MAKSSGSTKSATWDYIFPAPQSREARDDQRAKTGIKFFEYWKSLSDHADNALLEVWVYRLWPRTDEKLVNPNTNSYAIEVLTGPMPFDRPADYETWMRDKWGCGDYKFMLNQTGAKGPMMELLGCSNRQDKENYPPKLDINTVIPHLTQNEEYYKFCRLNGIELPWEAKREVDDMAGTGSVITDALKASTDAVLGMAKDRVDDANVRVEMAQELAEARVAAAHDRGPDAQTIAATRAIDMVAETAQTMVKMVADNSGKQYNAVEIIKATAEMMGNSSKGDDSGMMNTVLQIVEKGHDRQLALMDSHNKFMTDVLAKIGNGTVTAAAAPPQKTFIEQAEEYRRIAELFGWSKGPGAGAVQQVAAPPPPPEKESWLNETTLPLVVAGAQTVLILLANITHNIVVAKVQPPGMVPVSPADALKQAQGAGVQGPDPAPQQHQASSQADQDRQGWTKFVQSIEEPFLTHFLTRDAKGYTLAHFILCEGGEGPTEQGRAHYDAIKSRLGKKNFDLLVRGNDEIWSRVKGMPGPYKKFVDEFFAFDEFVAAAQQQAQATAPAGPVNGANGAAETTPAS